MSVGQRRQVRTGEDVIGGEEPREPGVLERTTVLPVEALLAELRTTPEGLSDDEAAARLVRGGPNELATARGPSLARQLWSQLVHFFALMLWVAAALALVGGCPSSPPPSSS